MGTRHLIARASEAAYAEPQVYTSHSTALRRWSIVDEEGPAVHTGFGICELDSGGSIDAHLHSFEETVHVLEGEAVVRTSEGAFRLRPGDYGLIPVGLPHAWSNAGPQTARWADMRAPQPRSRFGEDTFFVPPLAESSPITVNVRDPRTRSFGHIEPGNMLVERQTQDMLAVSASMRTALLVYSGVTVKMMVDGELGAQLSTMFMVQNQTGGGAGPHDHPLEETYFILEGEVEGTFDGQRSLLTPGDVAFAGVGCVHGFSNSGRVPVRWLETQAPQPPTRHSYRFMRDWDYLRDALSEDRGP